MDFYQFIFYGLIAVGAILIIALTIYRIDWARHPEKYQKYVEDVEKEEYWKKKKKDQQAALKKAKEKEKARKKQQRLDRANQLLDKNKKEKEISEAPAPIGAGAIFYFSRLTI